MEKLYVLRMKKLDEKTYYFYFALEEYDVFEENEKYINYGRAKGHYFSFLISKEKINKVMKTFSNDYAVYLQDKQLVEEYVKKIISFAKEDIVNMYNGKTKRAKEHKNGEEN